MAHSLAQSGDHVLRIWYAKWQFILCMCALKLYRITVDKSMHTHCDCMCQIPSLSPLSHGHATRVIPEFWHSHGHVNAGSTRVRPGLNPGSRPCLRAGFRPGFATRLRHNRIVSVKKWRKTDERGLSARRGCFCRSGARIGSSVSCRGSKEQCRISHDCRRAGKARLSAHARVMSAENESSQEKVQVHR